jgi:hypothetical protein
MQQITVESCIVDKLCETAGQVVVCDEQGRALGFFVPISNRPGVKDLQLEPLLSIEETEKLRENRTGKPLEEILTRLGY